MTGITTEQWLALTTALAWPVVALVALLILRPSVLKLVQGVFELNEAVSKASELRALARSIDDAKNGLVAATTKLPEVLALSAKLDEIQEGLSDVQGQQSIAISSKSHDETPINNGENIDDLFENIRAAWDETKQIVTAICVEYGVSVSFVGNKGIADTVDILKEKNATFEKVGEQLKDLGRQWQWMYRTSTPREDWLTGSAVETFVTANQRVRAELTQAAMTRAPMLVDRVV